MLRFDATRAGARTSRCSAGSAGRRLGAGARRTAAPHVLMRWPIDRIAAARRRAPRRRSAALLAPLRDRPSGSAGPASSATTARPCPAPTSSPPATRSCRRWSSATRSGPAGARCWSTSTTSPPWAPRPVGLLDAVGARDASFAAPGRSPGCAARAEACGVPGARRPHPARRARPRSSVTALGRTDRPGARPAAAAPGHARHGSPPTSAAAGGPATPAAQWDSTTGRHAGRAAARWLAVVAGAAPGRGQGRQHGRARRHPRACSPRPAAAAPCSTSPPCPRPAGASAGDWLTCFPGFAHAHRRRPGRAGARPAGPAVAGACGALTAGARRRACAGPTARLDRRRRRPRHRTRASTAREDHDDHHRRRRRRVRPRPRRRPSRRIGGIVDRGPGRAAPTCSSCPRLPRRLPRRASRTTTATAPTTPTCRPRSTSTARRSRGVATWPATWSSTVGLLRGGDGDDGRYNSRRRGHRRRRARPRTARCTSRSARTLSYAAGDRVRRVRHAGRPDGHDDLLRQGLPGGRAGAGPRRRRDRRVPVGLAGRAHRRRPPDLADDRWTQPLRPVRPGPGAGEPDGLGRRPTRPGTFGSLRFVGSAKVVDPGGDVLADHRRRGRAGRRRRRRRRRRWTRPAGRWATCATGARTTYARHAGAA